MKSAPVLFKIASLVVLLSVYGCSTVTQTAPAKETQTSTAIATATAAASQTPTPAPTRTATDAPTPTPAPTQKRGVTPSATLTLAPLLAAHPKIITSNVSKITMQSQWGRGAITDQQPLLGGKLNLVTTSLGLFLYDGITKKQVEFFQDVKEKFFSQDQSLMIYQQGSTVSIYDLANRLPLKPLPVSGSLMTAGFSNDNKWLALVHSSTTIDVINLDRMEVVSQLSRVRTSLYNEPTTNKAVFSPDNQYLLTQEDGGFVFWKINENKLVWYLKNIYESVNNYSFSPDGNFLLTTDGTYTYLRETRFGTELFSSLGVMLDNPFSPDGKLFALNNKGVVTVYTTEKEPGVARLLAPAKDLKVEFTPLSEDKLLFAAGQVYWTLPEGNRPGGETNSVDQYQISPEEAVQLGHYSDLTGFVEDEQGKVWVYGRTGSQVYLLDLNGGSLRTFEFSGSQFMANVVYQPVTQRFAACTDKGLEIINVKDNTKSVYPGCINTGYLAFSPDGAQIARASVNDIEILNANDGELIRRLIEHTINVNKLVFSADGKWLAAGTIKNNLNGYCQISLWKLDPLTRVEGFRGQLIPGGVNDLAVTPDGAWLVGITNMMRLWQTTNAEQMKYSDLGTGMQNLALSPDGKLAATSDRNGQILIFLVPELNRLKRIPGHPGGIVSLGFTRDGTKLVSLGKDGIIRLWDAP